MKTSRRNALKSLSATAIATAIPNIMGGTKSATTLPSLRKLAQGRPLIGAAVPNRFAERLSEAEKHILASQFDSITPENCMKWESLVRKENEYNFEPADEVFALAKKNNQKVVGHTLVFNRKDNYPEWVFQDGEKEADAKLVWKRIESHMEKVMTRYKDQVDSWDVLNEFVELHEPGYRETDFTRVLGPEFPVRLFKLAAQLAPKAKLTYNDFAMENPKRRKAILAYIQTLQDRGCRIDVVGSQSHLEIGRITKEQIDLTIKDCAKIGVKCAFTELDVDTMSRGPFWNTNTRDEAIKHNPYVDGCPDEILQQQADVYRDVFSAVIANRKHVDRVTLWGISDAHSWLNKWPWERTNYALLFDRQAKPKPAFFAVAKALAGA